MHVIGITRGLYKQILNAEQLQHNIIITIFLLHIYDCFTVQYVPRRFHMKLHPGYE